jgi:crotonobetainyl-CoA:carnitine CoA-transferase CaiB-like acyl-CoA transferase
VTQASAAGALQGIRVLDFSAMVAGPYCTRLMADLGAEVIKVEPPEGDYMRSRAPLRAGRSIYFGVINAGKQSIALDLKRAEGVALARELAAASDVVVENFRPGVMKRLGFGYETLAATNPGLVYCSISGYGQTGRHANLPAYAPIVQAASGFDAAAMAYQRADRPLNSAIFIADYLTGVHAFGASCAALVRRQKTGRGEAIDCALMDAMLGMLAYEVAEAQEPVAVARPLYQATRAKDGFLMLAPISQGNFEDMVHVVGRDELKTDPRYATPAARTANWDALMAELDRWAADRSVRECEAAMAAGGVPCARYQTVADVMDSPYAAERDLFASVQDGGHQIRAANPPFKMAGARSGAKVPALGEHGPAILERVLGRGAADVARLMKEGVLCKTNS